MPIFIRDKDIILAIIIPSHYQANGIHFFTEETYSQQLAYMHHPAGKLIEPHIHTIVNRQIQYTQEVLFIKSGKIRVDFYSDTQVYLQSYILQAGDIILLASGGHGFEVLEELEMFEVKQGPYLADKDKIRFQPNIKKK